MMLAQGASIDNLEAQIYGGAIPPQSSLMHVGQENVFFARKILKDYRIKIISEDVEGNLGRKIIFNTFTGETVILKVKQLRKTDWRYINEKN